MFGQSCNNSDIPVKLVTSCHQVIPDRAVTRTLIWGGGGEYSYTYVLPDEFFLNQIQIHQFEKKSVKQNKNI